MSKEEAEAYGHNAIDLVVLDSSYELYYRGEPIQTWTAEDLLTCPNINPYNIQARPKHGKANVNIKDDEAQCTVPHDVYWGKA
jgi:hypothetical protein